MKFERLVFQALTNIPELGTQNALTVHLEQVGSPRISVRPSCFLFMIFSRYLLPTYSLLLLTFLLISGVNVDAASDSLYKRENAKRPSSGLAKLFGPKSSRYKYDQRMIRAAKIAEARARTHSVKRCWRYVKKALVAAEAVDSYPGTAYAKQAGYELTKNYGFKPIKTSNPNEAPVGSILVYGGRGAGHVEIRTSNGFVSDFKSKKPSKRPLIGVYIKPS